MKFRIKNMIHFIKKSIHRMSILIVLFAVLCIGIPVLIFMQKVYLDSTKRFEKTLIETVQTETNAYAELLEQEFSALHKQMYSLLSDGTIESLGIKIQIGKYDVALSYKLEQVQLYMQMIKNCHMIVNDIEIYYPDNLRKIGVSSMKKYEEGDKDIESIVTESYYGNFWNDAEKVAIWNSSSYSTEYENLGVIIVTELSKRTMKAYLDTYKKNGDAFLGVCVKNDEKDEFWVSTDTLFSRECLPEGMHTGEHEIFKIDGKDYLLTSAECQEGVTFYQMMSFDNVTVNLEEYKERLNFLFMILVIFLFLFVFIFCWMVCKPIEHAKKVFGRMENGEFGVQMGKTWYIEFQEMYNQFDSMSKHIQNLIEKEYQLRLLNTKAQMKQLQYQINPHFLYNTYFTLCGMIQDMDYENAEKMAELMGKYLKYITVSSTDMIVLEEELRHARIYAEIQNLRFSDRIDICFEECPDNLKLKMVPKLIVQPLIENAFAHGIGDRIQDGIILIKISESGNTIKISVEDNGDTLTDEKLSALAELLLYEKDVLGEHVALLNIHRRLVMQFGEGSGLYVSRSKLGGLLCGLVIVMQEEIDEKDSGSR